MSDTVQKKKKHQFPTAYTVIIIGANFNVFYTIG